MPLQVRVKNRATDFPRPGQSLAFYSVSSFIGKAGGRVFSKLLNSQESMND
jgi:hypothetical protein